MKFKLKKYSKMITFFSRTYTCLN